MFYCECVTGLEPVTSMLATSRSCLLSYTHTTKRVYHLGSVIFLPLSTESTSTAMWWSILDRSSMFRIHNSIMTSNMLLVVASFISMMRTTQELALLKFNFQTI